MIWADPFVINKILTEMSATSNFSYAVGYAFDWMANPLWNSPELRSPIPCRAGYNCTYSGVCSFVHPGEEGAERRLFPARNAGERDMVRLTHPTKKPEYYRRRELRLSWPEWCARQGLPAPVAVETPGGAAPSGKRKQRIVLAENNSSVPVTVSLLFPIPTLPVPQPVTLEELLAASQPVPTVQSVGDELYRKVDEILQVSANVAALQRFGWYTPSCTAGKIVGMLIDAYSLDELQQRNSDTEALFESIIDCCEELAEDKKRKESFRRATQLQTIGWGDIFA